MAEHEPPGAAAAAQAAEIISALRRAVSPEQTAALVTAFYAARAAERVPGGVHEAGTTRQRRAERQLRAA
jgi:hypothetical protein